MHFVKSNLKLFLRLVSTDIHSNEVQLTANEFNSLRILFKVRNLMAPTKGQPAQVPSLSSLTPFYTSSSHSTKIHIDLLQEWILHNMALSEDDAFGLSP